MSMVNPSIDKLVRHLRRGRGDQQIYAGHSGSKTGKGTDKTRSCSSGKGSQHCPERSGRKKDNLYPQKITGENVCLKEKRLFLG